MKTLYLSCLLMFLTLALLPTITFADTCTGIEHIEHILVLGTEGPLQNASVRFYTDANHRSLADNLLTAGTGDAQIMTDSNGRTTMTLAAGNYFVTVNAINYQELTVTVVMPADGICDAVTFNPSPVNSGPPIDISKSTVSVSPQSIVANGKDTATVAVQAFNRYGSVVSNVPADLSNTLSGVFLQRNSTSTNRMGIATFTLSGTVAGMATLVATLNQQALPPIFLTFTSPLAETTSTIPIVSREHSGVVINGNPGFSDGVTPIVLKVYIYNDVGNPIQNARVTLRSENSSLMLDPAASYTDALGSARFEIKATSPVKSHVTVMSNNVVLDERPVLEFLPPNARVQTIAPGTLIKLPDDHDQTTQSDSAVYYVALDGKRHVFPNEKIFNSWYSNYNTLRIVDAATMASIPLNKNVTYRPAGKLIKLASAPKVYAVAFPNSLRWVPNESLAIQLYGTNWNLGVDDLSEAFFSDYQIGNEIKNADDLASSAPTTITLESVLASN